jgi:hypothetical protein
MIFSYYSSRPNLAVVKQVKLEKTQNIWLKILPSISENVCLTRPEINVSATFTAAFTMKRSYYDNFLPFIEAFCCALYITLLYYILLHHITFSTRDHEVLYADRSSKNEQISIRLFLLETKNMNMAGG